MSDEAKAAAAEMANKRTGAVDSWVADGTKKAEPVTTETPADANKPADEAGEDTPKTVQIKGRVGETEHVFDVPEGFELLLDEKKGQFAPVDDVRERGLLLADYTRKSQKNAERAREIESIGSELQLSQARLKAREEALTTREAELRLSYQDPKERERMETHFERLENDPVYAKQVRQAEAGVEAAAERDALKSQIASKEQGDALEYVQNLVKEVGDEEGYELVDQQRVLADFGLALETGRVTSVNADSLRQFFDHEKEAIGRATSPLQTQIDELSAQLTALKQEGEVDGHNANTQKKIARQQTPGQPIGGEATAPAGELPKLEPGTFQTKTQLEDRIAAWMKIR